ncbi:putative d-glycerate 3-kinase [Phaeomoniella chlamydospora]|uniref:Putative d-glycerate 3-kinase n=1 Tax=Phaeomoniella chlamydospora TaxID=158046 RepID=A0A0G2GVZ6_PHACM|nr:putative d-glycerate 3-kinase [Phaeomoniella chlamydospora]
MDIDVQARKVIDLISSSLSAAVKKAKESKSPVILGLTGLQGSGKSTWAGSLVRLLTEEHGLRTITVSLDDLYLPHDKLVALRESDPSNGLWRKRGQPGTHDEALGQQFFARLRDCEAHPELRIPSFDKSKFNGEGDRAPITEWPVVQGPVDVVVFEGWCVGFRPLTDNQIEEQWQQAVKQHQAESVHNPRATSGTLANHKLEQLLNINRCLERYCATFMGPQHFDILIHLDTEDLQNVFNWRLQQEEALIKLKGSGMKDEEVIAFIQGYMPAYELYLAKLREGFFHDLEVGSSSNRQVTVLLDPQRKVLSMNLV